jgi:hypothetical protein
MSAIYGFEAMVVDVDAMIMPVPTEGVVSCAFTAQDIHASIAIAMAAILKLS